MPSSADLAALVEALLLRGLRPAGNATRDGRPGSKPAIYHVEDRALSGCEAGVSLQKYSTDIVSSIFGASSTSANQGALSDLYASFTSYMFSTTPTASWSSS